MYSSFPVAVQELGVSPPHTPRIFFFQKLEHFEIKDINCAFWRYLKRCFGSWKSGETFEIKDANWCILTLFETMFWKLKCGETFEIKDA